MKQINNQLGWRKLELARVHAYRLDLAVGMRRLAVGMDVLLGGVMELRQKLDSDDSREAIFRCQQQCAAFARAHVDESEVVGLDRQRGHHSLECSRIRRL